MPKESKDHSVSHERFKGTSLYCDSSLTLKKPSEKQVKEWEEARCPVCMEHPHNGILLICSSYENGCRPYMCDTSHRHSNCFDQFRKASNTEVAVSDSTKSELTCPLCRGHVKEWIVVESARGYMNSKRRSCSCETCEFNGTYSDLRKHARMQHPEVRPSEVDPERHRTWRRLERNRDLGDLLSTLQSSLGGDEITNDDGVLTFDDGGWFTVFFLIRVFRPESSGGSGTSRARSQIGVRRRRTSRLWGESYEGDRVTSSRDEENHHQSSDEQEFGNRGRRVRRRVFIDVSDDEEEEP